MEIASRNNKSTDGHRAQKQATPPPLTSPVDPLQACRLATLRDYFIARRRTVLDRKHGWPDLRDRAGASQAQVEQLVATLAEEGMIRLEADARFGVVAYATDSGGRAGA